MCLRQGWKCCRGHENALEAEADVETKRITADSLMRY